jgi:hypothetical protein
MRFRRPSDYRGMRLQRLANLTDEDRLAAGYIN